jgi:hypothetical protein
MNIVPLRKTIYKETGIFAAALIMLAAIMFYLSMVRDDLSQKKSVIVTEINMLASEKQALSKKFIMVKESMPVFEESRRWIAEPGLFIDSQAVRDLFNYYQAVLFLKKMSVEMQQVTDDPQFTGKFYTAIRTNARVSIEALSDEDVYSLIRVMQKELPGFIKITDFSITKKFELSKDILTQVRESGPYSLVGAEIIFDWYGIRDIEAESTFNKYVPRKREIKPK